MTLNLETESFADVENEAAALTRLEALVKGAEFESAERLLDERDATSRTRLLSRLSPELQQSLVTHIDLGHAADLIHEMPDSQALGVLKDIDASKAAEILVELPKKEQADIVGELPAASMNAILSEMEAENASVVRKLAAFSDEEAGGIMRVKYFTVLESETVGQVIDHLRDNVEKFSDFDVQYAYAIDSDQQLKGVLRLRDLLITHDEVKISEVMIQAPLSVNTHTKLPELHHIFDNHKFVGIPVVNHLGALVGVLRRGDVEEAMSKHFQDDYTKTQGLLSEEIRAMPTMKRARRRLGWLSINIVLNIIAASVIAFYQDTLEQVIALAVFLPIISDMCGCSGNQAVAVSMRELSLGLVEAKEVVRVWLKEISVGLINGVVLGLLIAAVAFLWKGNPWLGLVVGFAMLVNTIIAVSLGGTLPLLMRRFNMDPALASGPILTTVTDMCGFMLVLGGATVFLSYLV